MSPGTAAPSSSSAIPSTPDVRSILFGEIRSPGAYVCNWSGHLLRIPKRASIPADALVTSLGGREQPLTVTKISDDPSVPLADARRLAQKMGLTVGF